MKNYLLLFACFCLFVSCEAPEPIHRVTILSPEALVDYMNETSGKFFIVADWCGGCSVTFTNIILPELEEYNYTLIYFGTESKLESYLSQHDSLQIIWVDLPFNNPLSHKSKATAILESLDKNYQYQWQFPIHIEYADGVIGEL